MLGWDGLIMGDPSLSRGLDWDDLMRSLPVLFPYGAEGRLSNLEICHSLCSWLAVAFVPQV